ncbi:cupin domain-containing protein [Streptomyces sp. NRRL S-495]|uniref:cupin domain-containing protein n=1 Tax=Streptomyces sp. NRRL S-495 TaxID=1609133 RepID=UPI0007C72944|nr:cupin domain-containing protein [Streptomyces sp. NRRL S-495]
MTATRGRVVELGGVKPITWGGETGRWLLRGEDTGGLYSFFEVTTPPGGGPPLHIHEDVDEAFYVVEGEYEIRLDGELHKAGPGSLVYGPRGIGHAFVNTWDRPSRMLCVATPGGVEEWFEELGQLLEEQRPPDWDRMQALASRHRIVGFRPRGGPPGGGRPGGAPGGAPGGPGGAPGGAPGGPGGAAGLLGPG